MVSARHLEPSVEVPSAGVSLRESSVACEEGGGFEKVVWRVRVNDGWMDLQQVLLRRRVGAVRAELREEDDPYGEAAQGWSEAPPQVWWRREIHVEAPIGTRFRRRHRRPNRELARAKPWLSSMPYDTRERDYELRDGGRLVSLEDIAEGARRRVEAVAPIEAPGTTPEVTRHVRAILAMLSRAPLRARTER